MTASDHAPQSTEWAMLRSELLLPLTELRGDVRLILQRMDQGDARAADHAAQLQRLDDRVDALERVAVTCDALQEKLGEQRAQADEQARRRLTIIGLLLTATSIGASTLTAVIIALVGAP